MAKKKPKKKTVLVTEDKSIHKGAILSSVDKEILESVKTGEGMIAIESVEQLQEMAKQAAERFEEFKELCSPMTFAQAKAVRKLRVENGFSWRAVAEACHRLDWGKWSPPSNQIMGMALCERAARFFGENYEEVSWN